jgi:hypothetical protein
MWTFIELLVGLFWNRAEVCPRVTATLAHLRTAGMLMKRQISFFKDHNQCLLILFHSRVIISYFLKGVARATNLIVTVAPQCPSRYCYEEFSYCKLSRN